MGNTLCHADVIEPCDARSINSMNWQAPAAGYVGQAN